MRKFITIIIIIISVTAGALFIKAMLDFKKEAAEYLENKKNVITKEPKSEKFIKAESGKSNPSKLNNTLEEGTKDEYVEQPFDELYILNEDSEYIESINKKMVDNNNEPEASKDQKKLVANTLYNELFIDLGLTEEEIGEFKNIIADTKMSGLYNNGSDHSNSDEKIKELLGELYYEVYEEYNETLMQRMKIMQYKQQLALLDIILLELQESNLLSVMLEEGKQTQLPDLSKDPDHIEQKIKEISDNFSDNRAKSDKKILERALRFLDTEQIEVLEKFLDTTRYTEETKIKMISESYNNKN